MSMGGKILVGLAAGAGLAYVFDAQSGRRRRALLRDRTDHLVHAAGEEIALAGRDVENRGRGLLAEVASRLSADEPDDQVLVARVRSKIGHVCSHPHAIEVNVRGGNVELKGPILAAEHDAVLGAVERVRGVRAVDDDLEVHTVAGNVPGLQGQGRIRAGRMLWRPAPRVLAGTVGGYLVVRGLASGGPIGGLLGLAGAGLLARSVMNVPIANVIGLGGRRLSDLQKTVEIEAPIEEVFAIWDAPEQFPRFMRHVKEVRRTSGDRWHWKVEGPAGSAFEWDAICTRRIPNQEIAWETTRAARVKSAGIVQFERIGDRRTRIHVRMTYAPPAGAIGDAFAKVFHVDAKHALDDDLLRLQSLLERGKTRGHEAVSRESIH